MGKSLRKSVVIVRLLVEGKNSGEVGNHNKVFGGAYLQRSICWVRSHVVCLGEAQGPPVGLTYGIHLCP